MMEHPGVIYALHFGRRKRYIGSTSSIRKRISAHWSLLARGTHHSIALQNAVNKYGLDTLLIEILADGIDPSQLLIEEQRFLDLHKGHTYNCSPTASSRRGCKERPETKEKRSASLRGNSYRLGIPHDAASRAKISEAVKRAIAEGRKLRPTRERFDQLRSEVYNGLRPNPWKRSFQMVVDVLTHLSSSGSIAKTGRSLGMNKENVRAILRNSERALNALIGQPSTRKPHQRGYSIHPDWFDLLEEALACNT